MKIAWDFFADQNWTNLSKIMRINEKFLEQRDHQLERTTPWSEWQLKTRTSTQF